MEIVFDFILEVLFEGWVELLTCFRSQKEASKRAIAALETLAVLIFVACVVVFFYGIYILEQHRVVGAILMGVPCGILCVQFVLGFVRFCKKHGSSK